MKSTSGQHYLALDHVRAFAALMVFVWHFTHSHYGYPVPFEFVPSVFFLALFDEGHTGVSLFMALSGYLFAKLLDGKNVHYGLFFWNRFLRLVPLLALVMVVFGVRKVLADPTPTLAAAVASYAHTLMLGAIYPTWPSGGWSITVEVHFYLLLPLLLWLRKHKGWTLALWVGVLVALRWAYFVAHGEVQSLSYWTIVGRFDQFALGILAFEFRRLVTQRHALVAAALLLFAVLYWQFDRLGGYHDAAQAVRAWWVFLPTLEGLAYGIAIAYYDSTFKPRQTGLSALWGRYGEYSYSIYLLHGFVVFWAARNIDQLVLPLSNFYVALPVAVLCFLAMYPISWLSYRYIESPFLRYRRNYLR
jgi:peptidoglycan/LPS O-acetylase OafA/YrhL